MTAPAENHKPPVRSFHNVPGQPTLESMSTAFVNLPPSAAFTQADDRGKWSQVCAMLNQLFLPPARCVELLPEDPAAHFPGWKQSRELWIIACCQKSLMIRMSQLRTALGTQRKIKRHILGKTDETSSTETE